MQRSVVTSRDGVDIGAVVYEQAGEIRKFFLRGVMKRCHSIVTGGVDVGTVFNE